MTDKPLPPQLQENAGDYAARAMRASLGSFPLLGPFVSELVTAVIPNQREDRWLQYTAELGKRVKRIEDRFAAHSLSADQIALFEDGGYAAVRSIKPERIARIASIVAEGLNERQRDMEHQRYLLRVFADLSEVELSELLRWSSGATQGDLPPGRLARLASLGLLDPHGLEVGGPKGWEQHYVISQLGKDIVRLLETAQR